MAQQRQSHPNKFLAIKNLMPKKLNGIQYNFYGNTFLHEQYILKPQMIFLRSHWARFTVTPTSGRLTEKQAQFILFIQFIQTDSDYLLEINFRNKFRHSSINSV